MAPERIGSLPGVVAGRGRPVVFLHGYPLNHSMWDSQLATLSARNRIVLLDLPGYGFASDMPVPDTLRGFSEAVRWALQARAIVSAVVVGHSFGGYVALQLYHDYPGLFQGLVLADTRSAEDPPEVRRKRLALAERLGQDGGHVDVEETARSLVAPATWASGGTVAKVVRSIVGSARPRAMIPTLRAIASRPDFTPMLSEIRVPTQVIWGEEDRLIPPAQTGRMVSRIPGSVGVAIPRAGHLPALESPGPFSAAVASLISRLSDR